MKTSILWIAIDPADPETWPPDMAGTEVLVVTQTSTRRRVRVEYARHVVVDVRSGGEPFFTDWAHMPKLPRRRKQALSAGRDSS